MIKISNLILLIILLTSTSVYSLKAKTQNDWRTWPSVIEKRLNQMNDEISNRPKPPPITEQIKSWFKIEEDKTTQLYLIVERTKEAIQNLQKQIDHCELVINQAPNEEIHLKKLLKERDEAIAKRDIAKKHYDHILANWSLYMAELTRKGFKFLAPENENSPALLNELKYYVNLRENAKKDYEAAEAPIKKLVSGYESRVSYTNSIKKMANNCLKGHPTYASEKQILLNQINPLVARLNLEKAQYETAKKRFNSDPRYNQYVVWYSHILQHGPQEKVGKFSCMSCKSSSQNLFTCYDPVANYRIQYGCATGNRHYI